MNIQVNLENDLVKIRPLLASDFNDLYNVVNDPKIWEQHPCKRNEIAEFKKFFSESLASNGAHVIFDKKSNSMIASSRYNIIKGYADLVEIGWTVIKREYWGGLYNKAIKDLMIQHAFNYVNSVILIIDEDNFRSQKAAEKIGAISTKNFNREDLPKVSKEKLIYLIENVQNTGS